MLVLLFNLGLLSLVLAGVQAHDAQPPLPKWTPSYRMNESTFFMPCNYSGWFDPVYAAKWGIVDFDVK